MGEFRITQAVLQRPVAGKQQQPLAIGVQPSHGVHVRHIHVWRKRALAGELAQHVVGLIEQQIAMDHRSYYPSQPA